MSGYQRIYRNPLAYSADAPGFDPAHPILKGGTICRFSGVAMAGSFVELQQLKSAGALNGSMSYTITTEGPAVSGTGLTDNAIISGLARAVTTTENTLTMAGIFRCDSNAGRAFLLASSSTGSTGFGFGTGGLTPYFTCPGQAETYISSLPNCVLGHSYFLAVSQDSPTNIMNAVLADRTTGAISVISQTSGTNGGLFPTNGNYSVGGLAGTYNGVGAISAALHINRSLSPRELVDLAKDPWPFWKPRRVIIVNRIGATSALPSGPLVATEAPDSAAFTGNAGTSGALAATEAADIAAFVGGVGITGTLAASETTDTALISGNFGVSGTLVANEAQDVAAFFGSFGVASGALAATEAQDIAAFAGTVTGIASGALVAFEIPDTGNFVGTFKAKFVTGAMPYPSRWDYGWYNHQPPIRRK